MGTTAASLARHTRRPALVEGPEHLHPALRPLRDAAAPVTRGAHRAAVVVVTHASERGGAPLALARMLAAHVVEHDERTGTVGCSRCTTRPRHCGPTPCRGCSPRRARTSGSGAASRPSPRPTSSRLHDLLTASVLLDETGGARHLDLPSGLCAEVRIHEVVGGRRGGRSGRSWAGRRSRPT